MQSCRLLDSRPRIPYSGIRITRKAGPDRRWWLMTFQLPENLERSVLKAVQSGKFASLDDAMAEATRLLLATLQQGQVNATSAASEDAFLEQLVNLGLMSQRPDTQADVEDPDDQPITIQGEPISETIIRERR